MSPDNPQEFTSPDSVPQNPYRQTYPNLEEFYNAFSAFKKATLKIEKTIPDKKGNECFLAKGTDGYYYLILKTSEGIRLIQSSFNLEQAEEDAKKELEKLQ